MLFAKKKRKKMIGIDIGSTSIKVLELSKTGRSLIAQRYGSAPLNAGVIVDHQIKDIGEAAHSLLRAVKKSGTKTNRGVVCVPSSNVISKVISVQAEISDSEIESIVEVEASRIVPYELEEVNIDYIPMGPSAKNPEEQDVQIVVCKKDIVEDLVAVLEEADIEPAIVDVDTLTLSRVYALVHRGLIANDAQRIGVLIDFGFNTSRFMVFHNHRMVYNKSAAFGGKQLIDSINQQYGTPYDEAIVALHKGDLPSSFKTEVLKPFVRALVQEVLRSLQFFFSSSTYNKVDALMLTGGCAQIGNLEKIIEKRIEVPTQIMNPFASMRIGSKIDKHNFRKEIPTLSTVSGLALRGVE